MNPGPSRTSDLGAEEVGAINNRLTEIARQIEYLSRTTTAPRDDDARERLSDVIARIDARLDELARGSRPPVNERQPPRADRAFAQLGTERPTAAYAPGQEPGEIDRAAAEIAARQRALDGDLVPSHPRLSPHSPDYYAPRRETFPPRYEPEHYAYPHYEQFRREPGPPSASCDLSAIEQQIRNLTGQLESLNRPCAAAEMVEPLRKELSEIGQKIAEAMPRRAIEALESEVRALAARLDASRQTGIGAGAVAGLERGLAEVREALLRLTPAESLVGFDHAVRTLTQKVEMLAAGRQDPAAMEQLENSIAALRGIIGNVASSESLAALAAEVRALAKKLETGLREPAPDFLLNLERRIGAISEAIEAVRVDGQRAVPAGLDRLIATLNDKIERLAAGRAPLAELSSGDKLAVDRLEDRITQLVEKLDESQARLGHLGAIERGMAELLVHLDDLRTHSAGKGLRSGDAEAPLLDALSRDVADLKLGQSEVKRLAQDSLEAVQGTIGDVVGRLAMIESDMRGLGRNAAAAPGSPPAPPPAATGKPAAPAPALAKETPIDPVAERGIVEAKPIEAAASATPSPPPPPQQTRAPIDATLPPDYPLEPGSGPPQVRVPSSPADRIAASEAPLRARMAASPEPASKSHMLQAARDAAKTAVDAKRAKAAEAPAGPDSAKPESKLGKRLRMIFVGLSVIALLAATLRYCADYFDIADLPIPPAPPLAEIVPPLENPGAQAMARETAPGHIGAAPPTGLSAAPSMPAIVAPGTMWSASVPAPETTGAVPVTRAPTEPAAAPTATPQLDSHLPAAIGSKGLIAAANNGDPAAAYEVATRYADGKGVPRNAQEAAVWFERAAKGGLAPALFRLGTQYEKGNGVTKNLQEARRLYLAAADKGNAHAMHNIAVLYAEGVDGKPDYKSAVQWFRKAAQYGIADSQYNLAVLNARGVGVEQNLAEAFRWFALAAKSGDMDAAKKRDDVAAMLDKSGLATAQAAVAGWTADREPEEAKAVAAPPGGWDQATAAPSRAKPRSRTQATTGAAPQ